ncbi:SPOR domain-containing protein [Candidatus Raskinella chloraquaticus]|uniref:SPOR domain-containing protein n=1 Tax=Candidatus Raskinella chloraquaticus TaxID=1951219 RepID=UPI00366E930B
MNESNLRRTNWTPQPNQMRAPASDAFSASSDPLEELQRALSQNGSIAPINPRRPVMQRAQPSPAPRRDPSLDDLFSGIDASAFEAALSKGQPRPAAADDVAAREPPPPVARTQERVLDHAMFSAIERDLSAASPIKPAQAARSGQASARDTDFDYEAAPHFDDGIALAPTPHEPASARRGRRVKGLGTVIVVLGLVVVGLAAVAGVSLFAWKGTKSAGVEPVIVRADPRPSRVVAELPPESRASNKVIFDRVPEAGKAAPVERLVPREEQPASSLPARPSEPAGATAPATQLSEPRRVSTTTIRVKPDGSLESEPTKPPSASGPAVRPETTTTHALAGSPTGLGNGQGNPLPSTVVPPGAVVSVPTIASAQPKAQAPNPALAQPVVREAPPASRAPVVQAPQAQNDAAGFMVQISSQRSRDEAVASFANLRKRYPSLLSGQSPDIQEVDLGSKGTFYRVRVGPLQSRAEAADFCTKYKAAGGSCVVSAS